MSHYIRTIHTSFTSDWRSPSGSSGSSTYNTHSKRRNTISLRTPTSPHRRAPPPPPPRIKFDPFADENSFEPSPVIYHTTPRTYAIHFPSTTLPQRRSFDKEARAKIVAGILLNRAQVGKPPRPRSMGEPKTYIKSCLSSVVSVEA
ncbi:hypothetical protein L208DRAFT_1249252 [Tricholoma matsutake]|nr:hypothetical protein L208DRAFT_1249252 [Tricholoma matsutake 945]